MSPRVFRILGALGVAIVILVLLVDYLGTGPRRPKLPREPDTAGGQLSTTATVAGAQSPTVTSGSIEKSTTVAHANGGAPDKSSDAIKTYALSGVVQNLDGGPVSDAVITVLPALGRPNESPTIIRAGRDGKFRGNVPFELTRTIITEAPGYQRNSLDNQQLPLDELSIYLKPAAQLVVSVSIGSPDSPVPVLFNGQAGIYLLRRTDMGTTVGLAEPNSTPGEYAAILANKMDITNGQCTLAGVEPGIYKVAVVVKDQYAESEPFRVDAGNPVSTRVIVGLSASFRGTIKSKSGGVAVAGAMVMAQQFGRPPISGAPARFQATSSDTGTFELVGIAPGAYTLTIGASGYTTKTVEDLRISPGDNSANEPFVLTAGQPSVLVQVRGGGETPVAGAPLVMFSAAGSNPRNYFSRTAASGEGRFENVMPGRYTVAATLPSDRSRQKTVEVVVREGEASMAQIRFDDTIRITGTAIATGKPYEGLLIFTGKGRVGAAAYATTDAGGFFSTALEPGYYVVTRGNNQTGTAQITVLPVESVPLRVEFK
ncbi:MAG: carboxypeptidase-like regulatory domain-containing protein [Candidatus Sumerlaeaceae bacterium]|nr:carboxypeptidase-like regulatory domain-containing protein [Candidatus Sumerlaeaceae bacterium]